MNKCNKLKENLKLGCDDLTSLNFINKEKITKDTKSTHPKICVRGDLIEDYFVPCKLYKTCYRGDMIDLTDKINRFYNK